jgi:predicted  nucleic acid-binding Zn-ribbon protein
MYKPENVMNTKVNVMETLETLVAQVEALSKKVTELETKIEPKRNEAQREMTNDDARRILSGDLKGMKHKDAAAQLGLSYGQVYSARLEFTFKHIHKEMKDANVENPWMKK